MFKNRILRRLALLFSIIMLITSTCNTTYGLIVTKSDSIINTFLPYDSVMNQLLLNKKVEHPFGDQYIIPENIAFNFELDFGKLYSKTKIKTSLGNYICDENGKLVLPVKANSTLSVQDIDVGTVVKVSELVEENSGFSVKDGVATKEIVISENDHVLVDYVNIYNPECITLSHVNLTGIKYIEGRDWQKGDLFSFKLEQKLSDNEWKVLGTKSIAYNPNSDNYNQFDFNSIIHKIKLDKIGHYEFRLSEIQGGLKEIVYDKTIKTFTVIVNDIDMDGSLEISDIVGSNNTEVKKVDGQYNIATTFNNIFKPVTPPVKDPKSIDVIVNIDKIVKNINKSKTTPEGFEFVLKDTLTNKELKALSNSNGDAFIQLSFDKDDIDKTFKYSLYEVNDGRKGVTYDKDRHMIEITITLDKENNKLVPKFVVDGKKVDKLEFVFENTYKKITGISPETSDRNTPDFWFITMILSAISSIMLAVMEKRYFKEENA